MSTLQLIYCGIIFVTVTGATMILLVVFNPNRAKQRLESLGTATGYGDKAAQADWTQTVVRLAESFAKLSVPTEGWEQSPMRTRFMHAGYRGDAPLALYYGAKTLLALLLPAIAYLYLGMGGFKGGTNWLLLVLLSTAAVGYYLPNVVLSRLVFVRQREIFENFPDAADLMLVCVESGLGLDAALAKVTEEIR